MLSGFKWHCFCTLNIDQLVIVFDTAPSIPYAEIKSSFLGQACEHVAVICSYRPHLLFRNGWDLVLVLFAVAFNAGWVVLVTVQNIWLTYMFTFCCASYNYFTIRQHIDAKAALKLQIKINLLLKIIIPLLRKITEKNLHNRPK